MLEIFLISFFLIFLVLYKAIKDSRRKTKQRRLEEKELLENVHEFI